MKRRAYHLSAGGKSLFAGPLITVTKGFIARAMTRAIPRFLGRGPRHNTTEVSQIPTNGRLSLPRMVQRQ